jgi:hypothetical protein
MPPEDGLRTEICSGRKKRRIVALTVTSEVNYLMPHYVVAQANNPASTNNSQESELALR